MRRWPWEPWSWDSRILAYRHQREFVDTAARAEGTVIELVEKRDGNSGATFAPVYTFRDAQGGDHNIHSNVSTYPPRYKVGETVTVLYRPEKPDDAAIDGFFDLWLMPLILGIFGAVQLIVGLVILATRVIFGKPTAEPETPASQWEMPDPRGR